MGQRTLLVALLALMAAVASARPGLLAVMYSYPTTDSGRIWAAVKDAKIANPELPIMAIMNPASGPGTSVDSTYTTAISDYKSAGIRLIGYVDTNYAQVPLATVKSNMDKWVQFYPDIEGFFLDQMKNVPGSEAYYTNITTYSRDIHRPYTMGNPGTSSIASYITTVDNSVIYENSNLPRPETLNLGFSKDKCSLIAYAVSSSLVNQTYINEVAQYVDWIWITDDDLANPYDANPTYFTQLVQYVVSAGAGSTPSESPETIPSQTPSQSPATQSPNTVPSSVPSTIPSAVPSVSPYDAPSNSAPASSISFASFGLALVLALFSLAFSS